MRKVFLMALLSGVLLISGCAGTSITKQDAGVLVGGLVGAALGGRSGHGLGMFIGSLVGATIGGTIGHYMDDEDRLELAQVLESGRSYQPTSWENWESGIKYTVTPRRAYKVANRPCRSYSMETLIGNSKQQVSGRACRQPDGSWRPV